MPKSALSVAAALCAAAALFTACSQNAGFGSPPVPGPQQPVGQNPNTNVSPVPLASGASPSASGAPAATDALSVASASGRYAYDGSESDPTKAPRYLELAYALKNPTAKAITVSKLTITGDAGAAIGETKMALTIPPGTTTDVALVAFKTKKDAGFVKSVTMTFADDKDKTLVTGSADLPPTDLPFVPLDVKDPKGGASVDGVEVSKVDVAGGGLHYEVTFALTNASETKVDIDGFTLAPPKAPGVKASIALTIPPRTTTGFISIVMPFKGKALPDGDYLVNAVNGAATVAKSTGALL